MKVEIIDSEDSKRMTIEELVQCRWIGAVYQTNNRKRMMVKVRGECYLIGSFNGSLEHVVRRDNARELLTSQARCYYWHVFDTAKELFAWMAE